VKVIVPGHVYALSHLGSEGHETLTFCRRNSAAVTHESEHPGTNTQEVLRVLIDRSQFLNEVLPCVETESAVQYLRMALECYEARALRRRRQKLNKGADAHEEPRERFDDVPFIQEVMPWWAPSIEALPTRAEDGHIAGFDEDE
jgi:hypothetical protein